MGKHRCSPDEIKGRQDWNAKLVDFFMNNSRLVILIALAILIGGAFSLNSLKRESFPAVNPKFLMIQTLYPGASAEEVESQVTKPLEAALKDAEDIEEVSSSSMNSASLIMVTLDAKSDLDQKTQEIRNNIITAESELPEDVEKPKVLRFNFIGSTYVLGISGVEDTTKVSEKIANELSLISDVKTVKHLIERPKQVVISIDPEKLAKTALPLDQLIQTLKGSNVNFPVSRLDIDKKNQSLSVIGAVSSIRDLKEVIIGANKLTGQPIKLEDIAVVKIKVASDEKTDHYGQQINSKLNISKGALLSIDITKKADIIRTRDKINDKIKELKNDKLIPVDTRVQFIEDQALETERQVNELVSGAIGEKKNLWILGGIQLVVIAMFLFVNFRAAILAALSIPLSLGFTFIFLRIVGIDLNTIVLFSLVLVLGLIVDPAIVIVESIQRFRDIGFDRIAATQAAARRYGAGIFMATLTNWIVFIPFGVVSGIMGEIIRFIPITVIPALVASYFVPMAILPWISGRFLKPKKVEAANEEDKLWPAAVVMMDINRWVLAKAWRQIAILVLVLILTILSVSIVGSGKVQVVQFSQPEDNRFLQASINFDKGLTFKNRKEISIKFERQLKKESGVKSFYYLEQDRDHLTMKVTLKDKRSEANRSKKIVSRLNKSLDGHSKFSFRALEVSSGPPDSEYNVKVQLYDNDLVNVKKAAKKVGKYIATIKGVEKVDNGVDSAAEPEVQLVLDRKKAQLHGLGGFQVGQILKSLFDETKISKYDDVTQDKSLDIMLKVDGSSKPDVTKELKNLVIQDVNSKPVKLSEIAKVESKNNLAKIERFDGQRFLTVQARVDAKKLFEIQGKINDYMSADKVKELGISGSGNRGEFEDIAESFTQLFIALIIAIFLTYVVLVLQFRSFDQPLIMLFTIPPSFIGVFPALWLLKNQFGFLELLGLTILVGIVENVAIFLIDYANQRVRQDGMDPKEAIILSSGVRFRPIILTKVVALGGLLPLAIESPFWRGLSATIIAGIGLSGIFSILIIPILYMAIVKIEKKIGFNL